MSKLFTARMPDGTRRFAASLGMGRARLFYDMTQLLEKYVRLPCGLADDNGEDEHLIDPDQFIAFFERFWREGWLGKQGSGPYYIWGGIAAGMIENITLAPREWVDRNGMALEVHRYLRPDEGDLDR